MQLLSLAGTLSLALWTIVGAEGLLPRSPTGVWIDASCDLYSSKMLEAMESAKAIAIAGYKAAQPPTGPYFKKFFESDQALIVQLVMKNLARSLDGHGDAILVKCNEDTECIGNPQGAAYMHQTGNWAEYYINICERTMKTLKAAHDFCSTDTRHETISTILLHEMTHIPSITNGTETEDWAYTYEGSMQLATGLARDHNGRKVYATENANNYVFFAETTLWWDSLTNPAICPSIDGRELRKLLSADGGDFDLPWPDDMISLPSGSKSDMTIHVASNTTDIVQGD